MISSADADAQLEAALASITDYQDPFQALLSAAGYPPAPPAPSVVRIPLQDSVCISYS